MFRDAVTELLCSFRLFSSVSLRHEFNSTKSAWHQNNRSRGSTVNLLNKSALEDLPVSQLFSKFNIFTSNLSYNFTFRFSLSIDHTDQRRWSQKICLRSGISGLEALISNILVLTLFLAERGRSAKFFEDRAQLSWCTTFVVKPATK